MKSGTTHTLVQIVHPKDKSDRRSRSAKEGCVPADIHKSRATASTGIVDVATEIAGIVDSGHPSVECAGDIEFRKRATRQKKAMDDKVGLGLINAAEGAQVVDA